MNNFTKQYSIKVLDTSTSSISNFDESIDEKATNNLQSIKTTFNY